MTMTLLLLFLMASVLLAAGYALGAAIAHTEFERKCTLCQMLRRRIEQFSGRRAGKGEGDDERG